MNKAIVVKATGEILFEGTYDECRASMRPAFMKHIEAGNDIDVFPLHIVNVKTEEDQEDYHSFLTQEPSDLHGIDDYQSESDIEATDFHNACGDR
jgi:hypothetical protein